MLSNHKLWVVFLALFWAPALYAEEPGNPVPPSQNSGGGEVTASSPEMVSIPAGEFIMGCNDSVDNACSYNEKQYHRVYLNAYSIDKYEVTVDEYAKCVKARKCQEPNSSQYCNWGKPDRGNHPVNCMDWGGADAYCQWAGKRLPTEAEWEKAARGTVRRVYPWGNEPATCDNAVMSLGGPGCGRNSTWPVGSKPNDISPYGVMDMAGNVWEWVQDWYSESYYRISPPNNPTGPVSGQWRVLRGGSWLNNSSHFLRTSERLWDLPGARNLNYGFRCSRPSK